MASIEKILFLSHMGPGGINCPCCGVPPGKPRRAAQRKAKKQAKTLARKEIRNDLLDMNKEHYNV